jgi:hypothetical protein
VSYTSTDRLADQSTPRAASNAAEINHKSCTQVDAPSLAAPAQKNAMDLGGGGFTGDGGHYDSGVDVGTCCESQNTKSVLILSHAVLKRCHASLPCVALQAC